MECKHGFTAEGGNSAAGNLKNNKVLLEHLDEEAIAIVGMAGRFPGANDLDEFWELLMAKGDGITKVPDLRWRDEQVRLTSVKERAVSVGFLKCPVDEFDAKFFGMSRKEAEFTDPQQRMLLEVSWEALEDAALDPHALSGTSTGIFTGTWRHDYETVMTQVGFQEFYRSYMGNAFGAAAGRLAFFYGTTGATVATESGCSSSMVAVGLACESLRRKKTNLAMACGVNLILKPFDLDEMSVVCSPDGHCKTFDEAADGYGRAEGCAVLVLKRLSDAVKDADNIRAVIRGYGEAQEGPSRSMGTPTVEVEAMAMELALKNAQVEAKDVSFVEAHGTGTAVGDPMEMAAIAEVYSKGRTTPLLVGSVKTNVGHTESASGITGIIKTVLALERQVIPPLRSLETLNPKIDLSRTPAVIPLEPTPWLKNGGTQRIAGVSSFGITGTDAHVILQEAPPPLPCRNSTKLPFDVLALSTKTEIALIQLVEKYADALRTKQLRWGDVTSTANKGRAHFKEYRAAVVASDTDDFIRQVERNAVNAEKTSERRKVVFLCPGQGSQYPGMAKELYNVSSHFRGNFDTRVEMIRLNYGLNISSALWEDTELLNQIMYSATSIFVVSCCIADLWKSWGVVPDVVLGHSMGEYVAAYVAGILSFDDALKLLTDRNRLTALVPEGDMIVVNAGVIEVQKMLKNAGSKVTLDVAAMNSTEQTTLAGTKESVGMFKAFCGNNGVKSHLLNTSHAFHSAMVDPMLAELKEVAVCFTYNQSTCKFISSVDGSVKTSLDATYWVDNMRQPVDFLAACETLGAISTEALVCVEIGPQPVLSSFVAQNLESKGFPRALLLPSLRKNHSDWKTMLNSLASLYKAQIDVNWTAFYRQARASSKFVSLPTYPFQRKKFWFEKPKVDNEFLSRGKEFHPLLQLPIANASNTQIFQTNVSLDTLEFLKDHVVAGQLLFPAAGYVEMALAASISSNGDEFRLPSEPVFLRDLTVDAPLCVLENVKLQTVVTAEDTTISAEDSKWRSVTFNRQKKASSGGQRWFRHATAQVSEFAPEGINSHMPMDVELIKASFPEEDTSLFYGQLKTLGLEFGNSFKTLRRLWRGKNETLAELNVPEISGQYVCHPLAIDAMIQSVIAAGKEKAVQLHVPIKIANFAWFSTISDSKLFYVHVDSKSGDMQVTLRGEDGAVLASMNGVTLVPTTAGAIEKALESQRLVFPKFYQEEWLPVPVIKHVELPENIFSGILSTNEWTYDLSQEAVEKDTALLHKRCALQLLQALVELGWKEDIGKTVNVEELCDNLGIVPSKRLFVKRILEMLSRHTEYVDSVDTTGFKITKRLPGLKEFEELLLEVDKNIRHFHVELACVQSVSSKTADVLQGRDSVLPLLFGQSKLAETVYTKFHLAEETYRQLATGLEKVIDHVTMEAKGGCLRILEIGAGTGGATRNLLPALEKSGVEYSYTFTDISSGFFLNAEQAFAHWKVRMSLKVLDIEKDPRTQGFEPGEFDVVIANHVLHATRNLSETIVNVRQLVRPSGVVLIGEAFAPLPELDAIFGLVDGYWIFDDFDLRPGHCILREALWPKLLADSGFTSHEMFKAVSADSGVIVAQATAGKLPVYSLPASHSIDTWLLFTVSPDDVELALELATHFQRDGRRVVHGTNSDLLKKQLESGRVEGILFISGGQDFDATEPSRAFLEFLQTFLAAEIVSVPKLVLVTKGSIIVGDEGVGFPHNATLWGMSKSFRSETPSVPFLNVDLDIHAPLGDNVELISQSIWSTTEDFVAVRDRQFYAGKLKSLKLKDSALQLPSTPSSALIFPKTNAISDLKFGPLELKSMEHDEVLVEVRASSLNFRDVFSVLKPTEQFESGEAVGGDVAGVVKKVGKNVTTLKIGDAVMGCFFDRGGLPSDLVVPETKLVKLPSNFSFEDGATLPTVFMTAFHCLVDVARLGKGETVLIHTASGGVGLAAIQVAREVGAKIIATAGSRRKRAFLRNVVGLENVFHSRDLSYADDVRKVTEGKGVDVVLNSLTSGGFKEATLDVVAQNGRFIEMSKLNVWSEEDVREIRPDVFYKIVDLTVVPDETWKSLLSHMNDYMNRGKLVPLPYVGFPSVEIRAALTYLQSARHIGKVVCRMPVDVEGGRRQVLFNERSSYLITGGLGGIGLEAARWMVSEGAKFLVLCGRRPPNDTAMEVITELNATGSVVLALQADVGTFEDCKRLVEDLNNGRISNGTQTFPPLRGIHHAAGCLSDGTFSAQTWAKYEATFNPKVNGAWHLHKLTQHAAFPLDHFVLYSSLAATFGVPGQSNHAAANSFLDSFAHFRVSSGLPATSVNWGLWGQIGVGADIELPFCTKFTPFQAFASLKEILRTHTIQVTVVETDESKLRRTFHWLERSYGSQILKGHSSPSAVKTLKNTNSPEKLWETVDTLKGDMKQVDVLFRKLVVSTVAEILKLDVSDSLDAEASFQDIGLDSLMTIELKNSLQSALGPKVTVSTGILSEANTVSRLASKLTALYYVSSPGSHGSPTI